MNVNWSYKHSNIVAPSKYDALPGTKLISPFYRDNYTEAIVMYQEGQMLFANKGTLGSIWNEWYQASLYYTANDTRFIPLTNKTVIIFTQTEGIQ